MSINSNNNNEYSVNYVEPNLVHNLIGTDGNMYEIVPPQEDYCVVVNIGVTVEGKRYMVQPTKDGNRYVMTWNATEGTVNFMQGTKMYYEGDNATNGEYINSLTTNYADITPRDYINSNGKVNTSEMFGIESIDINYDNYYVPQVTVKFIDIRGMSLFMPEEYRHRKTVDGISGTADNDAAGSFFKSFFSFPYPKFDLMVKGIYGKPVVYELAIVDWKATFDCNSGSFGCIVNFIGYSYALLSDITLNAILACSESDYVGKQYFQTNNNFVYHEGYKMKTFREFWDAYKTAKEEAVKVNASSVKAKRASELDDQNMLLNTAYNNYNALKNSFGVLKKENPNGKSVTYDFLSNKSGDEFGVVLYKDDKCEIDDSLNSHVSDLQASLKSVQTIISVPNMFLNYDSKKIDLKSVNNDIKDVIDTTKYSGYTLCNVIQFGQLKTILKKKMNENKEEIEKTQKELEKAEQGIIEKHLGFHPDIENLIRMFCAHIDTLVHCIDSAATSAMGNQNRKLNSESSDFGGSILPPFPKVTKKVTIKDNDITNGNIINRNYDKYEDAWIGDAIDGECPEADLVDGLLNGIKLFQQTVQQTNEVIQAQENNFRNYNVSIPIAPYDFMNDAFVFSNPNERQIKSESDLYNRIMFRIFTILSTSTLVSNAKVENIVDMLGVADAISFYNSIGKNVANSLKEKIKNGINNNNANSYLNYTTTPNSYPWGNENLFNISGETVKINKNYFSIKRQTTDNEKYNNSYFFPLSNLSFSPIRKFSQYNNEDVIVVNRESDKHSKYMFNILDSAEYNTVYNRISNGVSFSNITNSENYESKYKALYKDNIQLDNSAICQTYYSASTQDDLNNMIEKLSAKNKDIFNNGNKSIFGSCYYYYQSLSDKTKVSDLTTKAKRFLNCFVSKDAVNILFSNIKNANFYLKKYPKPVLLMAGLLLSENDNNQDEINKLFDIGKNNKIRSEIVNELIRYYNEWLIDSSNGFSYFMNSLQFPQEFINQLDNKEVTNNNLADTFNNYEKLKSTYDIDINNSSIKGNEWNLQLTLKDTVIKGRILTLLTNTPIVILSNKNVILKNVNDTPTANLSSMVSYGNSFFNTLKELYNKEEQQDKNNSNVQNPNVTDDIRITLYNYLKLVYDRWLCGKSASINENYSFNALMDKFIIIDSFYFKVGRDIPFNIRALFDKTMYSLEQETFSLASFLQRVLADNNMNFLSIQNFADLSNKNLMNEIFTPIPYRKMGKVIPKTSFVCMYTYKSSNNLNNVESDYTDDGFMLNDNSLMAKDIPFLSSKRVPDNGYEIPAFGVAYGKQYQSYFTMIEPTMENPIMTEQSLKAQYILAQNASDSSKKITFYGQDLYTIYSNNSYTCTVEMLGCAWIQPLMYFVLLNVPLYRGSYLIQQVSHHIQQGRMITRFVGTRMNRTCTRFSQDYTFMQDNTATARGGNDSSYDNGKQVESSSPNCCAYDTYNPSVVADEYLNDNNMIRSSDYYDNTKLSDLGITEHSDFTLREGIFHTVWNEAKGEGETGQQLVATVILNRAAKTSWDKILVTKQFNGFGCTDEGWRNNTTFQNTVNKILENSPTILIGKTAEPSSKANGMQCVSQGVSIGEVKPIEMTRDSLSKIYMFVNLDCYAKAKSNPNGKGCVIKATKYAFTHGNHVFHYGPNADSDTSLWKETPTSNLSDLEKQLSNLNKNSFGVYCAIKKSAKTSGSLNVNVALTHILENNGNTFSITCDETNQLGLIFDMVLDTYSQYISDLCWVAKDENSFGDANPIRIKITCGNELSNKKVYIASYNNSNNTYSTGKNGSNGYFNKNSFNQCSQMFLTSLSKHYTDANSFNKECDNFSKQDSQAILDSLHSQYTFNCNNGSLSPYYNVNNEIESVYSTPNWDAIMNPYGNLFDINSDSTELPNEIAFPCSDCGTLNFSGKFWELRKNGKIHKGIDIGTRGGDSKIISILDGKVIYVSPLSNSVGSGYIVIKHNINLNGKFLYTRYLHGHSSVKQGDYITKGQEIGDVGGVKGYAKHLHFEMILYAENTDTYNFNAFNKCVVDPNNYYYFGKTIGEHITLGPNSKYGKRV